ncbi:MAG: crossover junction endodeoxyribonuclease RuvC [bacterium]|nr:crossover junction endodeoxyribonuclease RuvC [bacterium]
MTKAKPLSRVLAFDPGFERLGVAVVEKVAGNPSTPLRAREVLLYSACIRTDAKLSFSQRLCKLGQEAEVLIKKWEPDAVALEDIYFAKNAKTAMKVAEVRGMLAYIAVSRGVALFEYTPLQVKVAVTGHGRSDKQAVASMVLRLLGLQTLPAGRQGLDDEMDAIAVGLTCLACEKF